jgi:hypothetical protein
MIAIVMPEPLGDGSNKVEPGRNQSVLVIDIVLRAIGAFYIFASLFGLRQAATQYLMMQALSAIGSPDPRETKAERERGWCLVANLLLVGCGGIALVLRLDLAAGIFVASAAFYALYLFVLAPRLFDPFDPPEEPGRSQTWNAFWIYLAATALVLAAWWTEQLIPIAEAHPAILAFAAALGIALVIHGTGLMMKMRLKTDDRSGRDDHQDDGDTEIATDIARIRQTPLVMRPSWNRGAFFDARTDEPVDMPIYDDFRVEDDVAVAAWLTLFAETADPADPCRCAMRTLDGLQRMADDGRPVFERLVARMGPERIRFDPQPNPVVTRHTDVTRIKLMADYPNHPIWITDADRYEPVDPDDFGLSWQLARDIGAWEMEAAASDDPGEPNSQPAPARSDADDDAHEEQGRRLAVRLARELAATGRGEILVHTFTRAAGTVPVRPHDAID